MKLSACLAVTIFLWASSYAQTISVVRFQGGDPPITRSDGTMPPGFVGYFSPRSGDTFTVKSSDGTTHTETTNSDGGCRFNESRGEGADPHNGVDLIGWVEKVDKGGDPPGYQIHLFDNTWIVKNRAAGKVGGVNTDRDGISIKHPPEHTLSYQEEYEHIAVPASYSMGDTVALGATLGTLTQLNLGTNEWIHLHYACTNDNGVAVNPFTQSGARGLYEVSVPEPELLAILVPLIVLARKR